MITKENFKSDIAFQRYPGVKDTLKSVLEEMKEWADEKKLPFLITATVSTHDEDLELERISLTHVEGRAADISVRGWDEESIQEFRNYFGAIHADIAAMNAAGEKRLVVYHDNGNGLHFHVQIRPGV